MVLKPKETQNNSKRRYNMDTRIAKKSARNTTIAQ